MSQIGGNLPGNRMPQDNVPAPRRRRSAQYEDRGQSYTQSNQETYQDGRQYQQQYGDSAYDNRQQQYDDHRQVHNNYGSQAYAAPINVVVNNTNENINGYAYGDECGESYFDGTLGQQIGLSIAGFFLTVITLGFCYPWAVTMKYGWKVKHTIIQGRRLKFTGSAIGLFGNWVKWLLLTIITLGIYSFWLSIKLEQWKVKNTSYAR